MWRAAGVSYLRYTNEMAGILRQCLRDPYREKAMQKDVTHLVEKVWANGVPQSKVLLDSVSKGFEALDHGPRCTVHEVMPIAGSSSSVPLRIAAVTWNCAGINPSPKTAQQLLGGIGYTHDVVVVGFQEYCDLTEFVGESNLQGRRNLWNTSISKALRGSGRAKADHFICAGEKWMGGLLLFVFIRASFLHVHDLSEVETTKCRAGWLGCLGNKGAVAARIHWPSIGPICFVNCHMCAGQWTQATEKSRCTDFHLIRNQLSFTNPAGPLANVTNFGVAFSLKVALHDVPLPEGPCELCDAHSLVVWMGDMNTRLMVPPDDEAHRTETLRLCEQLLTSTAFSRAASRVKHVQTPAAPSASSSSAPTLASSLSAPLPEVTPLELQESPGYVAGRPSSCQRGDTVDGQISGDMRGQSSEAVLRGLLKLDELGAWRCRGGAFSAPGWHEALLTFAPTYKLLKDDEAGSSRGSYDTARIPGWCDRILWHVRGRAPGAAPASKAATASAALPSSHRVSEVQVSAQRYERIDLAVGADHAPVVASLEVCRGRNDVPLPLRRMSSWCTKERSMSEEIDSDAGSPSVRRRRRSTVRSTLSCCSNFNASFMREKDSPMESFLMRGSASDVQLPSQAFENARQDVEEALAICRSSSSPNLCNM